MREPLVSVVVPVYNGERFLALALRSVLAQDCEDVEVIAVDDGSTDGSREILEHAALSDSRLRVISRAHGGLIASLNLGCSVARGRYIARIDADDIALPHWLSTLVGQMERDRSIALIGAGVEFIDERGEPKGCSMRPPEDGRAALAETNILVHSTVVFRKAIFSELGGYRSAFVDAEDYDLWCRFADRFDVMNFPEILVRYRLHAGQVSVARIEQQALSAFGAQWAARMRREKGTDDQLVSAGPIQREALLRLGAQARDIDRLILRHALEAARRQMLGGNARVSAGLLERYGGASFEIDRRDKAVLQRTLSTAYRRAGKLFSSALPFGKAIWHDPRYMASSLLHRLGSQGT